MEIQFDTIRGNHRPFHLHLIPSLFASSIKVNFFTSLDFGTTNGNGRKGGSGDGVGNETIKDSLKKKVRYMPCHDFILLQLINRWTVKSIV
jgi:hypothetical protein